jgi:hypothetical protein
MDISGNWDVGCIFAERDGLAGISTLILGSGWVD